MSAWIIIALILSFTLNVLLGWYVIKILGKLLYVAENLGDLYVTFKYYEEFVENLYGMEMFYGEPIIEELIGRTKMVTAAIEEFENIYDLADDVEDFEEIEGVEEDDPDAPD